jgi:hypothetical protein
LPTLVKRKHESRKLQLAELNSTELEPQENEANLSCSAVERIVEGVAD